MTSVDGATATARAAAAVPIQVRRETVTDAVGRMDDTSRFWLGDPVPHPERRADRGHVALYLARTASPPGTAR